uniref:hypothetical protein n=1 Tax=Bartonella sp. AC142YNZD TaxID=3243448 RepID=UPI0035CE8CA5
MIGWLPYLYHDMGWDRWGSGSLSDREFGFEGPRDFLFDWQLWNNKEETYGTAISSDRTVYKAFTWKYIDERNSVEQYRWNGS